MSTRRPLRLSYHNGLLCGVCGGIAESVGWRPNLVRAVFVALSVLSAAFPGILLYAVLYLIMPGPDLATIRHRRPQRAAA